MLLISFAPIAGAQSCTPAPSGLVSWWRAEGNALDAVGGNDGTFSNASFSPGQVGQAFSFAGLGNYVRVPASSTLDVGSSSGLTIEAWINPADLTTQGPIVEWALNGAYAVMFYANAPDSAGRLYACVVSVGGAENKIQTTTGVLSANTYQHVALTYDKVSGLARLFRNGVIVQESNLGTFTPRTSSDLYIGYRPAGSPYGPLSFLGQMDEVSLYNRAFSTNEIQAIYAAGSAGKCVPTPPPSCAAAPTGLVSWWRAEGDANDTVGGLNGTLSNGVTFAAGKVGQAFSFDGANGFVQVGARPELVMSNAFTVEAWIFPTGAGSGPGGAGIIFNKEGEYEMDRIPDGTIRFSIDDPNAPMVWTVTPLVAPANSWTHVALVYGGGVTKIYGNGSLVQSYTGPSTVGDELPAQNDFRIGGRQMLSEHFKGMIDEVAVFKRALADIEIAAIYAAGSAGKCVPTTPPSCTPAPSGLAGWWRAEGNAIDAIDGLNGALSNGVTFANGKVGQAFSLDGVNDFVQVGARPELVLSNALTIEAWIYPTGPGSGPSGGGIIINKEGEYELERLSDGTIRWAIASTSPVWVWTATPLVAPLNTWTHVALVYGNGVTSVYGNGTLVQTNNGPAVLGDIYPTLNDFRIGARQEATGEYFKGLIDEVAVYQRALTASEITTIYAAGSAGKCVPTPPPSCVTAPAGLVSWWRGEQNALDSADGNNGTLVGNTAYGPGRVGTGIVFDGSGDLVSVGNPVNLRLQDFTIETWVKRSSPTVVSYGTVGAALIFGYGSGGYALSMNSAGAPRLSQTDGPAGAGVDATIAITDTNFHHLAATKSGTTVVFYVDGVAYPAPALNLSFGFSSSAAIGARADNLDNSFLGTIDEVSVCNRALTGAEIQAIYAAGSAGKCAIRPVITSQPASQTVPAGANVTFTVVATGSKPLSYQWWFNGTNLIANATNVSLTLVNVQPASNGTYSVVVSNPAGSTNSAAANLVVFVPTCVPAPAGLVGWWRAEGNAWDDFGGLNGTLAGGATFAAGMVGQAFSLDGVDDYVQIGDRPELVMSNALTVEAWIYPTGAGNGPSGGGIIVSKEGEYVIGRISDGTIRWAIAGTGPWTWTTTPLVAPLNTWTHVALVYDNGPVRIYGNGSLVQNYSGPTVLGDVYPTLNDFRIGSRQAVTEYFKGLIDEVAVFKRALAASEIAAIYAAGSAGKCVPTPPPSCITAPAGLVSWWRGEQNAFDSADGNNGALVGNTTYGAGRVGQGFGFDGNGDGARIGDPANLHLQDFTIEAWVKRASATRATQDPANINGSILCYGTGGYGFTLLDDGRVDLTKVDIGGVFSSALRITDTNFHHAVVTKSGSTVTFYVDGVGETVTYNTVFTFGTPVAVGARGDNLTTSFWGVVDEVSVYNRALSAAEIQAIYAAGSAGKCGIPPTIKVQPVSQTVPVGSNVTFTVGAAGSTPRSYQWWFNGTNLIANATNASLTLSNVQPAASGDYTVVVSNSVNTTSSAPAHLSVRYIFAFGNGQNLTNAQYTFVGPVNVQLQTFFPNGTLFYTLDGSPPTFASAQYAGTFAVSRTATLRVITYSADFLQSWELDAITLNVIPTYTLSASSPGGGTVSVVPPGGPYVSNTVVQVTANPASGWAFLGWWGDARGANPTVNVTMNRNRFVQARFGTTLNTTVAGSGSVLLVPPGGFYPYGTAVQLHGVPQAGNSFVLWGNAGSGNSNPLNFPLTNANPTVSSLFAPLSAGQYTLTVLPDGLGQVSVEPAASTYENWQRVTLTALPEAGQQFLGWSGDATGTDNPLGLGMTQSRAVVAHFTRRPRFEVRGDLNGLNDQGFRLTLTGEFGALYRIDGSTNLLDWTEVLTVTNVFGTEQIIDGPATNLPARAYKAVQVP